MKPNPSDYNVTAEELRERLTLSESAKIYPIGIEHMFNDETTKALTQCYDKTALLLRTTPDYLIEEENKTYLVEAKQKTTSVEAIGLLFNKHKERDGMKVIYSFPNVNICATQIPMETIEIPLLHRKDFATHLEDLFVKEGCIPNYWSGNPPNGSGDPFVRIDESDLIELSGGNL